MIRSPQSGFPTITLIQALNQIHLCKLIQQAAIISNHNINEMLYAKEYPSGTVCILRPGYCFYFSSPPNSWDKNSCVRALKRDLKRDLSKGIEAGSSSIAGSLQACWENNRTGWCIRRRVFSRRKRTGFISTMSEWHDCSGLLTDFSNQRRFWEPVRLRSCFLDVLKCLYTPVWLYHRQVMQNIAVIIVSLQTPWRVASARLCSHTVWYQSCFPLV